MALNLYLDDCANADLLAALLTQAGHFVTRPADAGIAEEDDEVHFHYCQAHGLILLTKNPKDFHALHRVDQNHPGIFAVYRENHASRDMTHADIVAAVGRVEQAEPQGYPIARQFHNLNTWR